jgi:DNA ligase-1
VELGVGESLIMKAIAEATGRTAQSLKAAYDEMGDLGLVAKTSRSNQRTMFAVAALTMQGVYKKLKDIALMQGTSVRVLIVIG